MTGKRIEGLMEGKKNFWLETLLERDCPRLRGLSLNALS